MWAPLYFAYKEFGLVGPHVFAEELGEILNMQKKKKKRGCCSLHEILPRATANILFGKPFIIWTHSNLPWPI